MATALWTALTSGICWMSASSAVAAPQDAPATGGSAETSAAPIELDDVGLRGVTSARPAEASSDSWRLSGLALLHVADGVGAGAQLRRGPFGVRASAGFETMFFIADDDPDDTKIGSFELASGLQLNLDTLLVFGEAERGASVGYRYNTVLGHGAAVAYQSTMELLGERFVFYIPFMYFPQGTERVRDQLGLTSRHRINFPFGAGFQYGMGLAWMF